MKSARQVVDRVGEVFAVFDQQGSGCVSYGVTRGETRLFVKTATTAAAAESLRSAVRFHAAVQHRAILPILQVAEAADSPVLVYPWLVGELLHHSTRSGSTSRTEPSGPFSRFRALPVRRVEAVLDELLAAHVAVAAAGFVAVDLYDGSFMYDFRTHTFRLIDLDEYRRGPFVARERLPGSRRFMAPEEYGAGSTIDERTMVFVLGRAMRLLLDAGDAEQAWRGSDEQLAIVQRATRPDPDQRFPTVASLREEWSAATR